MLPPRLLLFEDLEKEAIDAEVCVIIYIFSSENVVIDLSFTVILKTCEL